MIPAMTTNFRLNFSIVFVLPLIAPGVGFAQSAPVSTAPIVLHAARLLDIDAGKIIAIGQPSDVMANARVQEAYLGT